MASMTHRLYLIKDDVLDEDDVDNEIERLKAILEDAGVKAEVGYGIGILTALIPAHSDHETIVAVLEDEFELIDHWASPVRGAGRKLLVNLMYEDNDQVVSANLDENMMIAAMAGVAWQDRERRMKHAVSALAEDNDFTYGNRIDEGLLLQDIMSSVVGWDEEKAILWSPLSWAEDEPMLEISFQPQARLADGRLADVVVDGMATSWSMPLRLAPEGLDPLEKETLRALAALPCAPDPVRTWVDIAPFSVSVDNPEIFPTADADFQP